MTNEQREFWIKRLEATGHAQARYLWVLVLVGLFYATLQFPTGTATSTKVPLLDLELQTRAVSASGAPVLALLVLIIFGSMRAWGVALKALGGAAGPLSDEHFDSHPNAIDLAVYTTDGSPKFVRHLMSLAYPLLMTAALVEVGWLAKLSWSAFVEGRAWLLGVTLLLGIPAAILLLGMWLNRFKRFVGRHAA